LANEIIVLQIILITIIVYFGRLGFNKLFGQTASERREFIEKTKDVQNRLSESMGDAEEFERLQKEMTELAQQMLKKQLIPCCVSCITFIVLWAILDVIYIEYNTGLLPFPVLFFGDGWVGLYILVSFSLVGISYLIRLTYRKIKGIESTSPGLFNLLSSSNIRNPSQRSILSMPTRSQLDQTDKNLNDKQIETEEMRKDSWKDRIQK
jgi:uncharacterized membrane protein (DUF106 family)